MIIMSLAYFTNGESAVIGPMIPSVDRRIGSYTHGLSRYSMSFDRTGIKNKDLIHMDSKAKWPYRLNHSVHVPISFSDAITLVASMSAREVAYFIDEAIAYALIEKAVECYPYAKDWGTFSEDVYTEFCKRSSSIYSLTESYSRGQYSYFRDHKE